MFQSASVDTKGRDVRRSSRPAAAPDPHQLFPISSASNQARLRLMRKCECGGAPDCDCDTDGDDKKKKEKDSPKTGLHRKPSGSGAASALPHASTLLDAESQAFFEARLRRDMPRPETPAQPGPSLHIGAVDDPLEHEADRIADRVMRMTDPRGSISSSTSLIRRKCSSCEEEEKKLQKKGDGQIPALNEAPQIVHEVLTAPGQPLDAGTRDFFEPRFGYNLSQVRIHTDAQAAQSAQSVRAQAYAVGRHIAFGPGMYAPFSPAGRNLLAHELAHTVQQHRLQPMPLQRSCTSGAACAKPFPGDPGRFGEKSEKEAEERRKKSGPPPPGGAPAPCLAPHHKEQATAYTDLTEKAGAPLPPEVSGIFIDACMPAVAAQSNVCSAFTDGTPPKADANKDCIAVTPADEATAARILPIPEPKRGKQDAKTVLDFAATVIHEAQHTHFNANAATIVPAEKDCDLDTVIFHGPTPTASGGRDYKVDHYLSEISAEIAEFAPYFQSSKATGNDGSLFHEERNITHNKGENIMGTIQALQCKCECPTVDKFVGEVFTDATKSWPPDQTLEFQRAMTRIMPAVWPKALQKT